MQCKLGLGKTYRKRFMTQGQAKLYYEKISNKVYVITSTMERKNYTRKILE